MIDYSIFSLLYSLLILSLRLERVISCGGFMCFPEEPILQAGENIAFGVSANADGHNDVTMVVQIQYEGPASDFAWVLPIMYEPRVSVGSDIMFDVLFEESRPTFNFNVQGYEGTTCEGIRERVCRDAMDDIMDESATAANSTATVLEQDSVGPYDYVLLEPAETEPGYSVFTWLDDNGYDQPLEAFGLIDYYARQDQLFLALRLRKGTDTGDIQPIVLDYALPSEMANVACVPIQLTSIAATPDMPIQTYVLSEGNLQAFPVNYFTVELDDAKADWLGCQTSQSCFLNDMRDRLATFLEEEGIEGHAFVTEYAGTSKIIGEESIVLDVNLTSLENAATVSEFLELLGTAGVPGNTLVNTILGRYISNDYSEGVFSSCIETANIYQPESDFCHDFLSQESITNTSALVQELNDSVFVPTIAAQSFVNRFSYLTRFYGQLSPETMDKDPFFAFNSMLPDVSNVHEATAVPFCSEGNIIEGLEITVEGTTFVQPAAVACQVWSARGDPQFLSEVDPTLGPTLSSSSMALRLMARGYEGEDAMIVPRSAETGFFPPDVIADVVTFMDSRAPNQTVPPYNGTFLTGTEGIVTTTADDNNTTESDSGTTATVDDLDNEPPRDDEPSRTVETGDEGEDVTPINNATVEPSTSAGWTTPITVTWHFIVLGTVFRLMY